MRFSPQKRARRVQLRLEALGYTVTIEAIPKQEAPATPRGFTDQQLPVI